MNDIDLTQLLQFSEAAENVYVELVDVYIEKAQRERMELQGNLNADLTPPHYFYLLRNCVKSVAENAFQLSHATDTSFGELKQIFNCRLLLKKNWTKLQSLWSKLTFYDPHTVVTGYMPESLSQLLSLNLPF